MTLNRIFDRQLPTSDLQRTIFSIISINGIARFVCDTWDKVINAGAKEQFNVNVVGSRMYGAYRARKFLNLFRM